MIFFTSLQLSTYVHELNHSLLICYNNYLQIASCICYNILKHIQFNILQLYLNNLVKFFTFLKLSTSLHELNHPF
jgi:hypothetical protein